MSGLNEIFAATPTTYTPTTTAKLPKLPAPPAPAASTKTVPASVGISPRALALGVGIPAAIMAVIAAIQYLPWWLCLILLLAVVAAVVLLKLIKKRKRTNAKRTTRPGAPTGSRHPAGRPTGRVPFMKNLMNRIRPGRTPKQGHPNRNKNTGSPTGTRSRFPNPFANRNKNRNSPTGTPRQQGRPDRTHKRSPFGNPFKRKPQGNPTGRSNRNSPTGSRNRWGRPNRNKPTGTKTQGHPNRNKTTGSPTGRSWNPFKKPNKPKRTKPQTRTNSALYNPPNRTRPTGTPSGTKNTGSPQQNRDTGDRTWTASEGTGPTTTVHDSDWYSTTGRTTTTHAWAERLDEPITKVQDGQPRPPAQQPQEIPMSPEALPPVQPPQPDPYNPPPAEETKPPKELTTPVYVYTPNPSYNKWEERTPDPVSRNGAYSYEKDYAATTSRNIVKGMQMHPVEAPYAAKIASNSQTYAGLVQALTDVAKEAAKHAILDDQALEVTKKTRQESLDQGLDVSALERKIRELSESYSVRMDLAKGCVERAQDIKAKHLASA